ncbi:hypothetical protein EDM80_13205 [bacterium]|nr:MAG: hypothetical protein EDM80_13205 [bacterium]RIK59692.1 MAG: hypothetical protein DCC64_15625 [Planctomycetota bacterium]
MNSPLHPVLVHLPLGLAVIMPLISAGVLLAWFKGWLNARAWAVVVLLQLALAVGGFAAMQSGERDEDNVERVVPESAMEAHEKAAQVFIWIATATLALSAAALVVPGEKFKQGVALATVAGTLGVLGAGYVTGKKGGELVYSHNAASVYAAPAGAPAGGKVLEHRDAD